MSDAKTEALCIGRLENARGKLERLLDLAKDQRADVLHAQARTIVLGMDVVEALYVFGGEMLAEAQRDYLNTARAVLETLAKKKKEMQS